MLWRSNFFFFFFFWFSTGFCRFLVATYIDKLDWRVGVFFTLFALNLILSLSRFLGFSVSRIANGLGHEKNCLERSSTVWLKSNPLKCVCCEVLNPLEKCTAGGWNYSDAYIRIMENWKFYILYCGLRFCTKSKWKKERIKWETEK